MTRRINKFDSKLPTPIALSKKPSSRVDLETRLRKIDQQFQQDQDFAPSSSSTFMISNLKQELSHIKQDVEKLMMDDDYEQKPFRVETNSTFKQQLAYQKEIEEQLRREIRDLKIRGSEVRSRDDRTVFMAKEIEVLKRQQDILQRQKQEALQGVSKLKRELASVKISETMEIQFTELKRKFQRQKQQKQELESARRRLEIENSNLISELSSKTKQKQQFEGGQSEWKQQRYKLEQEISRLKLSLTNAVNNPEWREEKVKLDNEISRLKMQMVNSINNSEWKQEKSKLESEINKYKQMSVSSGDQWKEQKVRMENQLLRLQAESKKNRELLDNKYKANKEEMISSINSIKDLTEKNYEFVRKINNIDSELSQKSEELRRKQEIVLQQKQQIKTITKEKDTRYQNLMSEFRKLQQTLNRSAQQNLVGMKNTVFTLESAVRTEQADKQKLRLIIAELNQKVEKLTFNLAEQKKTNEELQEKIQAQIKNYQDKQNKLERKLSSKLDQLSNQLSCSKKQIFDREATISNYQNQIKNFEAYKIGQQKLKVLQIEKLNTSLETNQLSFEIIKLKQTIQTLEVELFEKNKVIQKLSQATRQPDTNQIQRVEAKYREIVEDQNQMIEENETIIIRLEKEIAQLKQNQTKVQMSSPKNSSFDDIFKEHIQQNQHLKLNIKNKMEQIFDLKNQVEDFRRKVDFQKNESQIDKLKNISDEKKIKSHYEIELQNIQADVESQKRKYQVLQTRLDAKVDQLKKKDQFIQNVIINKVGKDAYPTELEYITKEVNKFFTGNYVDKLVIAEEEIKSMKERLRVLEGAR